MFSLTGLAVFEVLGFAGDFGLAGLAVADTDFAALGEDASSTAGVEVSRGRRAIFSPQ